MMVMVYEGAYLYQLYGGMTIC